MKEPRKSSDKWRRFQKLRIDKEKTLRRLKNVERSSARHAHKFILKRWRTVKEVRRTIITWVLSVSALAVAAGLQLTWDQGAYTVQAGDTGGTYVEVVSGKVDNLNPIFADTLSERAIGQLVFSRLMAYDQTGNLNYDLAEEVEVDEARRNYRIKIRTDAFWHDGEPVTADDILFTTELLKDEATRANVSSWQGVSVAKIDEFTINVALKVGYGSFENALTFPILPAHILGGVDHDKLREASFSNNPIGSGPFIFQVRQEASIMDADIIHLKANERYYDAKPKVSRFQVMATESDEATLRALKLNEASSAYGISPSVLREFKNSNYRINHQLIEAGVYAFINTSSPQLKDKRVRQALQLATDTNEIRAKVGGDVGELFAPYTPFMLQGDIKNKPEFNIKEAEKRLDQAGWKLQDGVRKKDGQELRLSVVTTKNLNYERALEVLIGQWRQIGVLVNERTIDTSDPTQSFEQSVLKPRDYDVLIYQIGLPDPDIYPYWRSSQPLNLSNYSSAEANDILASARVARNDTLRHAKHLSFTKLWLEDVPAIGLYQPVVDIAVAKSVGGVSKQPVLADMEQHYSDVASWTVRTHNVYRTP